jgi:hypothetical protein
MLLGFIRISNGGGQEVNAYLRWRVSSRRVQRRDQQSGHAHDCCLAQLWLRATKTGSKSMCSSFWGAIVSERFWDVA